MAKVKTLDLNEFGKTRSTGFGLLEFDNSGYATVVTEKEGDFKRLCDISPTLQWVEEEHIEETHSLEKVQGGLTSDAVDKNIQSTSQEEIDEANQLEHEFPGGEGKGTEHVDDTVDDEPVNEEINDEALRAELPANIEGSPEFNEASAEETLQETVEESTLTEEERQALREVLQTKTIDELRQVCREAGISEDEIKDFKGVVGKINLIEFIISKNII